VSTCHPQHHVTSSANRETGLSVEMEKDLEANKKLYQKNCITFCLTEASSAMDLLLTIYQVAEKQNGGNNVNKAQARN